MDYLYMPLYAGIGAEDLFGLGGYVSPIEVC